jgi:nitrogen regulatory protein PII-like uncharacterized protein
MITYWNTESKEPNTFSLLTEGSNKYFIEKLKRNKTRLQTELGMDVENPVTPFERKMMQLIKQTELGKADASEEELIKTVRERSNKDCFIATVVYEDSDCLEVQKLRNFRDNKLNNCFFGKLFIFIYYLIGKKASQLIKPHSHLKNGVKKYLDILVRKI